MLGDDWGELGLSARMIVAVQQQVEHGHEMALAGAERPMQVGALAGPFAHR